MIIDVWSDVVCPWCFIGRRRLEKAIAALGPDVDVTVRHRAFQLNPAAEGIQPTKELLSHKYNMPADQVSAMQAQVCSIADGEGLCYDLDDTLSGNTGDAHRLLLWAQEQGSGDELLEAMYSSYFEKSGSLFDHESLTSLAVGVGLDESSVGELLKSNEFGQQVEQDQALAHQLGANGVPFYVVDMKYGISGAQPQEAFDQTLQTALNA
jgi:predicted DsbA family dithiol-disulfide isomerase